MIKPKNIVLNSKEKNKCFCTCYLYETHEDIVKNLYINQKYNKCDLGQKIASLSKNKPCYIWITILSPFLTEWFLDAFQHSLIIRRLTKMQYNYKLTTFEELLRFYETLCEETLLYKTKFLENTNHEELIESNIKKFYENSWSIFSLNSSLTTVNLTSFYKNINPILYYNLTSAHEITSCLQQEMKSAYIFVPILKLFEKEFKLWLFDPQNNINER